MGPWPRPALAHAVGGAALLAPVLFSLGCAADGANPFSLSPPRDDVVAITSFYNQWPWLRDADDRVVGIRTRVYFVSSRTDKGVFVPGTITAKVNAVHARPDGTYERELIAEWSFDEKQAMGLRLRDASKMGQSYGLILKWPPGTQVVGRRIEVVLSYQRADGRVINAPPRQFTVTPGPEILPELPARPATPPPAAPPKRPTTAPVKPRSG